MRFVDPDGLVDVVAWDKLSKGVQEDLLKHKVTKEKWDSWSPDQRQRLVNFRARMIVAGVWSAVDKVGFVSWRSDGKTTVAIENKDPKRNFELAFTTKPDINVDDFRGRLSNAGITNDFFVHSEAAWSNHEGGLGISIHVLGFKAPKRPIYAEGGTISYTYDANSNLLTKQDARLIRTTYFYER